LLLPQENLKLGQKQTVTGAKANYAGAKTNSNARVLKLTWDEKLAD